MSLIVMSLQSGVIGLRQSQHHWSRLFVSILISFSPCWMRAVLALGFVFNTYTQKHRTVNGQRSSTPAHIQDQSFSGFISAHSFLCLWMFLCPSTQVLCIYAFKRGWWCGVNAWTVRRRVGRACCCFLWIKHTLSNGRSRERERH